MIILSVQNLNKNYKEIIAVKNVSFDVSENEIFALIGPNGAGKSTALKMIATLLTPSSGTAVVCGYDIIKEPEKVRSCISYLAEEAGAYKNLSGLSYLKFMAALYNDEPQIQKENVNFAVEIFDLKDRLKDKIKTYSKGMTRKLLLARTVMTRPKLAVLDEPTSGLDVVNAMEIRNKIKELVKAGMSVLLSSHNMLEIEYLSDRVAFIDKGEILEIGKSQDLKNKYQANNLEEVFVKLNK